MKIKLRHLTIGIFVALNAAGTYASEFDLSFLQGGAVVDASAWKEVNSKYIPGRYLVGIELNGKGGRSA